MFKIKNLIFSLIVIGGFASNNVSIAGDFPELREPLNDRNLELGLEEGSQKENCKCIKDCANSALGVIKKHKKFMGLMLLTSIYLLVHNNSNSSKQVDTAIALMIGQVLGSLSKNKLLITFPLLVLVGLGFAALDSFILEPHVDVDTNLGVVSFTGALWALASNIKSKVTV